MRFDGYDFIHNGSLISDCFEQVTIPLNGDDTAKNGRTITWKLFTVIPCAPRHSKRQ